MKPKLFRTAAHLQLALAILMAIGCSPTQPFFLNESPDLQYYLNTAAQIEYPDVETESLAETTEALPPLRLGNHEYQFWDLTLEECTNIALHNAKFFVTTGGNSETRQNVVAQFTSASADQLGSIYDVAIQQTTTQSVPLAVDSQGNRTLPRGVLRANQIGGVEDALAEFDAQTSGFLSYSTTDRPRNTGVGNTVNPPLSQATDITQQAAVSKRFATGGVATLRQQVLYNRNNVDITSGIARSTSSDYTVLLEAQVQHPLMRNRGAFVNRIPVVLASINTDIQLTDFEIQVRNLVRDVEVAYWDLYTAYRAVATAQIGRNSAQATAFFARQQLRRGAGTVQEKAQAEGQFFTFKGRLQAALAGSNIPGDDPFGVYGRERDLRAKMGIAPTDGRLIRPVQEPTLARVQYDWDEVRAELLYLAPELRRAKYVIQQRELETKSALNQLLPEVNLSLLYRWVGQGDTLGPPSGGDAPAPLPGSSALGELTSGDFQEGVVRLDITPAPIGGRRERARVRNSQLRIRQARDYLEDNERLMITQLSDAIAKVLNHYQLIQTNAQAWQRAEVEVEARLAEYELGSSQINVVLQAQQRKADAELSYYRALSEYNKSLSYVDYLKGTSLANSNITLAEGPWDSKAYRDALERARERSAGRKMVYGVTRPNVQRRGPVTRPVDGTEGIGGSNVGVGVTGEMATPIDGEMYLDGGSVMQPIEVPNRGSLSDFGDTPAEMFDASPLPPDAPMATPSNGSPIGNGVIPENIQPLPNGSIPSVAPELAPPISNDAPIIDTLSYESPTNMTAPTTVVSDKNDPSGFEPVRRRPLPTTP